MTPKYALVREPGNMYTSCLSEHPLHHTVSLKKAREQHSYYCDTLAELGIEIIRVSRDDKHPDSCFVEDNAVIGAHSIVMPGTHMKKNSILAGSSMTTVGQELEEGWVYLGAPAKKYKKNVFFEDDLENIIASQIEKEVKSKIKPEDLYTIRKDKHTKI